MRKFSKSEYPALSWHYYMVLIDLSSCGNCDLMIYKFYICHSIHLCVSWLGKQNFFDEIIFIRRHKGIRGIVVLFLTIWFKLFIFGGVTQVRSDWDSVKIDVMYRALKCKFSIYPHLNSMLLSTAGSVLVEASPHDLFWGGGRDGEGLNYLGRLLMQLRSEFLGESSCTAVWFAKIYIYIYSCTCTHKVRW